MDYEKLKSFRNINNNFAKLLGIELTELSNGYAKAEMKVTKELLNPIGSIHGGCLYTIADIAGGAAASSYGIHVTTIDGNFHYLRAGINTKELSATATEIKKGKLRLQRICKRSRRCRACSRYIFIYVAGERDRDINIQYNKYD